MTDKIYTLHIEKEIHLELKRIALEKELSLQELVQKVLIAYLKKKEIK